MLAIVIVELFIIWWATWISWMSRVVLLL